MILLTGLQISHEGIVIKMLEKMMKDKNENISYFIYKLNYGKEYQEGCIYDDEGNIDISTAEKLYDYLMSIYPKNEITLLDERIKKYNREVFLMQNSIINSISNKKKIR